MKEDREEIYNWLKRCLVGPFSDLDENGGIRCKPVELYPCGLLFPSPPEGEGSINGMFDTEEESEDDYGIHEDDDKEDAGKRKRVFYRPPSAIGLTFFVEKGTVINLSLSAYRYYKQFLKGSRIELWKREPVSDENTIYHPLTLHTRSEPKAIETMMEKPSPLESGLYLHQDWRPYSTDKLEGHILTLSLINRKQFEELDIDYFKFLNENTFFQVEFACRVSKGAILPYPMKPLRGDDEEAQNLELIYRNHRVYAVGHGISVGWEENTDRNSASIVRTEALPCQKVPLSTTRVEEIDSNLRMHNLAKIDNNEGIFETLESLVSSYESWKKKLEIEVKSLPSIHLPAAKVNLKKVSEAVERMRKGIAYLKQNRNARSAFASANHVMGEQLRKQGIENPAWRPFQIAFILLTLESVMNNDSVDRVKMDLLWFSTGGGKTEAYLGLIAMLLFFRRLEYPTSGDGTAIIMRYTLRMLTAQQFERAAKLISAMEIFRRNAPDRWGETPFTIGLWVGKSYAPNRFSDVEEILKGVGEDDSLGDKGLVVSKCPGCGTPLRCRDLEYGSAQFHFYCPEDSCGLYSSDRSQPIPIQIVDEALYQSPPSLLLATVDKFARLPWEERTRAFFGLPDKRPPELIIQDELHLISGEIGSMAGTYEAAIDSIVYKRGVTMKYIASTATISNVQKQSRKLYSRNATVFPPSGLDVDDSFFSRRDSTKDRLYIGYLSHQLSRKKSLAPLASCLLVCPSVFSQDEKLRDAWWTWLLYHGSLKGIGISKNQIYQNFSEYLNRWLRILKDTENSEELPTDKLLERIDELVPEFKSREIEKIIDWRNLFQNSIEITSRRSAGEIQSCLERLDKPLDVTLALCTNMIATGIDVNRLGGMILNGQPPTTAEYIQASSRVGRGSVPGLVIAHYYRNQARDISHYENFKAYHQSFYRFVEPTSVTPYALASLKRTLPAALVSLLRLSGNFSANDQASQFNPNDPSTAKLVDDFKSRCKRADPEYSHYIDQIIDQAIDHWNTLAGKEQHKLRYQNRVVEKQFKSLLASAEQKRKSDGSFDQSLYAPDSLRNVDSSCNIFLTTPQ